MKTRTRWMTAVSSAVPAFGLMLLCLLPSVRASTLYWDAGGAPDTLWSTTANWDAGVPGTSDTAVFNASTLNSAQTITLGANLPIGGLVFTNTGTTAILGVSANRLVTLGGGGMIVHAGAGAVTLGSTTNNKRLYYLLGGPQSWVNHSANNLAIVFASTSLQGIDNGGHLLTFDGSGPVSTSPSSAPILGTGGLTKTGSGTLTMGMQASTYTGTTTINAGTLSANTFANVNTVSSLGKGSVGGSAADLVIGGGTLRHDAANVASTDRLFTLGNANGLAATIDSSATLAANSLSFTSTGALSLGGNGARTLTLTGSNLGANTFRPVIDDGAGGATALVKGGLGTWVLSGANTYTRGTTLSAGTLKLSGSGTLGATSGSLSLSGGTLDLGGTSLTVGALAASGGSVANGTLTASSVTVQRGILQLDHSVVSSPRTNILAATQGLTLRDGGVLSVKGSPGFSNSQTLLNLTVDPGFSQVWNLPNGSTSNVLNLGEITAPTGSGLFVVNATNGVVSTSMGNDATDLLSGRMVYRDSGLNWAHVNFATRNADGSIGTNANFITVSTTGSLTPVTGANYNIVADNYDVILASDATVNSLRAATPGTFNALDLNGRLLTLSSGGILLAADGNYDYTLKNGRLTAGSGNELIFNQYSRNVLTCNALIVDNGNPVAVTLVGTNNMAGGFATLTVGTNNTYSGGTFISNGALLATSFPQALGSGEVVLNGGKLRLDKSLAINDTLSGRTGSVIDLGAYTLTVTQAGNSTFAGSILNTGAVVKAGSGALTISGTNTYSGGTTVEGGTLLVCNASGSGTGTNTVIVKSGATLGGTGSIAGAVTVENGGTLGAGLPGAVGTLSVSNIALSATSTVQTELGSPTSADRIVANGNVTLDGALTVSTVGGFSPSSGMEWTIATGTVLAGSFTSVTPGYEVTYQAGAVVLRCASGNGTVIMVR